MKQETTSGPAFVSIAKYECMSTDPLWGLTVQQTAKNGLSNQLSLHPNPRHFEAGECKECSFFFVCGWLDSLRKKK